MAEKFPQLTPYNYAGNKCITHKDLEGLQSTDDNEEDVNENNKNEPPKETESNYSEMLDEIVIYFSRLSSEVSETIQSDINRSDKDWERMKKDFKPISEFIGKFLNFEPRGGIVGYADSNFTQDGIAEPNKAKAGDDVTYVDLIGLQVAAVIYGPQLKGKIPEGTKITKDLFTTFIDPAGDTSEENNISSPEINDNDLSQNWIITKHLTYPSKAKTYKIDTLEGNRAEVQKYMDSLNKIKIFKPYWNGPEVKLDSVGIRLLKVK